MSLNRIAVAQTAFKLGDVRSNLVKMVNLVETCMKENQDTQLIVFPELTATGYFLSPELYNLAEEQDGRIFQTMEETARENQVWIVYGYVEKDQHGHLYNSIQLVTPLGESASNYRKIHLTPLERDVFTDGSEPVVVQTELGNIGLMICWDLAFPELARVLTLKGADLLVAPSAWESPYDHPFTLFGAARAIDNTVYVATCNHVGASGELIFFGKSAIFGPDGDVLAMAEGEDGEVVTARLDYQQRQKMKQDFFTMLGERREDIY